jgi:hypothetical protein
MYSHGRRHGMVKVWIHKPGGEEPFLVTEMSVEACAAQFDLADAEFLKPLGAHPPTPAAPGPLGDDQDPELVLFEVLPEDQDGTMRAGYYVSHMTADTVQELIGEEWAEGTGQASR